MEMVELNVEARQGDSGGPILNGRGEIAGVLFGAGQGTTLGSFAPRVSTFLASLAPDIGQVRDQAQVAVADRPAPNVEPVNDEYRNGSVGKYPSSPWSPVEKVNDPRPSPNAPDSNVQLASNNSAQAPDSSNAAQSGWTGNPNDDWFDHGKSGLAIIGLAAIALRIVKFVS
jgi:hypothetical protein